jgi:hypothetical protein
VENCSGVAVKAPCPEGRWGVPPPTSEELQPADHAVILWLQGEKRYEDLILNWFTACWALHDSMHFSRPFLTTVLCLDHVDSLIMHVAKRSSGRLRR